jgi:CheY-like chemotaxis protein
MNGPNRILLVEDSDLDAELTLSALRAGHLANVVVRLRDGAEALDYLYRRGEYAGRTDGNPAVVLLDLKMPRVDGKEVLREMKLAPDLSMIPVVIMTSSREEADLEDVYRAGANAYVVKPLEFSDFASAVQKLGAFWAIVNEPPPGTEHLQTQKATPVSAADARSPMDEQSQVRSQGDPQ